MLLRELAVATLDDPAHELFSILALGEFTGQETLAQ